MHFREALTHLHSPLHAFCHPQRNNSEHDVTASGSNVHSGFQVCVELFHHPQASGEGNSGVRTCACPDTCPPWYTTRFVCLNSAAPVGGMASIDLALVQNICFLVESTVVSVQVQVYRNTTYVSRIHMTSSLMLRGFVDKVDNTAVTSLIDFQMSKAVFFTLPANDETVLQPVKSWNMGSARHMPFRHPVLSQCHEQECISSVSLCPMQPIVQCSQEAQH